MKNKKVRRNRTFEKGTHKKEECKKLQERTTRGRKSIEQQWRGKRKSEEEREEKGSLKTKHKKSKANGNPKSRTSGALTPLTIMCHVATMCTAPPLRINVPPLRIKCGTKPQDSCLGKQPFTFWWSSWHVMMTTEPGGAADGTNKLFCPDGLIKHLRLPSHGMDEEKQTINEELQCLGQLPISCQ